MVKKINFFSYYSSEYQNKIIFIIKQYLLWIQIIIFVISGAFCEQASFYLSNFGQKSLEMHHPFYLQHFLKVM